MALTSTLITGGAGFVGLAIVQALRQKHPACKTSVLDLRAPDEAHRVAGVDYIQADITSATETRRALTQIQPQLVIHTAGMVPQFADRYGRQKEAQLWRVNVEGTRNVLAASKAAGVKALVYTSSIAVLFDDLSRDFLNVDETVPVADHSLVYGESKAAAEKLVLAASSPSLLTCALRPSMILGPGDPSTIPPFHGCIARGETPWAIGSGDNLCDFTYVDNVADAHVLAGEKLLSALSSSSDHTTIINSSTTSDTEFPAGDATHVNPLAGEAIYITNGQPIAFRTFCLAIWAEFGHVPAFQVRIPEGLASVLGLVSEWWTWLTRSSSALNRGSVRDACATRYADISKARRLLGYQPRVDLVDGVRRACEAYKEQLGQQEEEP